MTTSVPRTMNQAKPTVVIKSQRREMFLSVNPYGFNDSRRPVFCKIKVAYAGAGMKPTAIMTKNRIEPYGMRSSKRREPLTN